MFASIAVFKSLRITAPDFRSARKNWRWHGNATWATGNGTTTGKKSMMTLVKWTADLVNIGHGANAECVEKYADCHVKITTPANKQSDSCQIQKLREYLRKQAVLADKSSHEWEAETGGTNLQSAYRAGMWYAYHDIENYTASLAFQTPHKPTV